LGSGSGRLLATLTAFYGLQGYGVDVREVQVNAANHVFDEWELSCRAYVGNFFPPGFDAATKEKWGRIDPVKDLEKRDVYAEMGLSLDQVDVFGVYQYQTNVSACLRMISQRASSGAVVMLVGYSCEVIEEYLSEGKLSIPENITLVDRGLEYSSVLQVQ
jgi:hypothetical protein